MKNSYFFLKYRLFLTIIVLVLTSCRTQPPSPAVGDEAFRFFEETGQSVQGDFLRFFYIYGGLASLGYPLTGEIKVDSWVVQYFEKGRLEYHPENELAYRITVGWLGELLHRRHPPLPATAIPRANDPNRRYYAQTGHTLSGDFLHYFETHGGTVRFGLPISEPFLWQGRLTQDFQSARFFWTPEEETPVILEEIGRIHLEASGLDKASLKDAEVWKWGEDK